MIFEAVGRETKKVYARGISKAELMRKLQNKYPYKTRNSEKQSVLDKPVFPEQLRIIKRSR